MEQYYGVYLGDQLLGKVQVSRQGLYYHFCCRCQLSGKEIYCLQVSCGRQQESLGVLVPMENGFGLDTNIPMKRLGEGVMTFQLLPKKAMSVGKFMPICPEEPFAYIARLKNAYLVKRNGQHGIIM